MTLPIAHIQCMISNLGLVVQRYPPRGMTINDENAKTMLISKNIIQKRGLLTGMNDLCSSNNILERSDGTTLFCQKSPTFMLLCICHGG